MQMLTAEIAKAEQQLRQEQQARIRTGTKTKGGNRRQIKSRRNSAIRSAETRRN